MKTYLKLFIIALFLTGTAAAKGNTLKMPADSMLNDKAPNFILKDINGKTVSLADYKGKVLILDFWATWCVPCRNSFPAVKMAVEKYKNDPDVKILFSDTRETESN